MNTKFFIYIGIMIGLLIAWCYRANLKDGLAQKIQKTAKLSPYTNGNVEDVVKHMDR